MPEGKESTLSAVSSYVGDKFSTLTASAQNFFGGSSTGEDAASPSLLSRFTTAGKSSSGDSSPMYLWLGGVLVVLIGGLILIFKRKGGKGRGFKLPSFGRTSKIVMR